MMLDLECAFSNPQTVTTGTDTGLVSTNIYDLGLAGREIGPGKPLYVVVVVTTAFTSAGSDDDLAVNLVTGSTTSPTTFVQELAVIPRISAVGTKVIGVIAPKPGVVLDRYIALQYKSKGDGALTAGAVKAYLVESPDAYKAYAKGYTIN